jgi:hypothetical protein
MRKHTVTIIAVAALLGTLAQPAGLMAGPGMKRNTFGVLADVDRQAPPTLHITTKDRTAREIRTDAKTEYVKWITQKAAAQDTRADATALVAGRCVDVEPRTGNDRIAKIVRISDEPSGSTLDPCKAIR